MIGAVGPVKNKNTAGQETPKNQEIRILWGRETPKNRVTSECLRRTGDTRVANFCEGIIVKKELVALVLSIVMAASGICAAPAYAAETTIQETANVQEESVEEQGLVEGTDDVEPEDIDVPDEQSNEGQNTDSDQVAVDTAEVTDSGRTAVDSVEDTGNDQTAADTNQETDSGEKSAADSVASSSGDIFSEDDDADSQESREAPNDSIESRIVDSGKFGECEWRLYEDGSLYIDTEMEWHYMSAIINDNPPWKEYDVKKVIIADGVTQIQEYAFNNCSSITSVEIPGSVDYIGGYAFAGCKGLKNITIPESVTLIEDRAFMYSGLTNVTFPGSVKGIEYYVFSYCTDLEDVTIREGVTNVEGSFQGCTALKSVTFPSTVTRIGADSFNTCSSLKTLKIPTSVTSIGTRAFLDSGLSTIYFYGSKPTIDNDAFGGVECTAYYPNTWDNVPDATAYGGNVTWISWDPPTEIPPEVSVGEGYVLDDVSNVEGGIQVSLPAVLEKPETCPDGFYLLRKEDGGEYKVLVEYQIVKDPITPYTFEAQTYTDTDVECSKKYFYAIRLFKGDVQGEIGPSKEIIRNWIPEINMVTSCDMNRFPIHVANNDGIDVSVYFQQGKIPVDYTIPSEDTVVLGSFNGFAQLQHNGSVIMSSKPGSILVSEDKLTWSIGMQELMNASLPADAECLLCICDKKGNKITEYPIKTSFERLSFCNRNKKEHESEHPGTRVLDEQLIADELTIDFFGRKQGKYLIDHCKEGEPLGFTGLCFGMVVATDQFQAGLLSAQNDLNQRIVDLADQQFNFVHGGQHGTNTLLD